MHIKCVLVFHTALIWYFCQSRKNSARNYHKYAWLFM